MTDAEVRAEEGLKENPWICDKCGSRNLDQGWVFYAPMNEEGDEEQIIVGATQNDFYWCKDCEEECSPTQAYVDDGATIHHDFPA